MRGSHVKGFASRGWISFFLLLLLMILIMFLIPGVSVAVPQKIRSKIRSRKLPRLLGVRYFAFSDSRWIWFITRR